MVRVAERLMAERGIEAVSLRSVMLEAGQRNKSAAQYHFGSRDGLIAEILIMRMGPINERRFEMLRVWDDSGRGDLRELVKCLLVPLAEQALSDADSYYARFLARSHADPLLSRVSAKAPQGDSWRMWIERTLECMSQIPEPIRRRRVDAVANNVVFAVADWEAAGETLDTVPLWISDLADSCVGFLTAPTSAETDALLGTSPRRRKTR
jgi:AcrR family transcriptional regulator